MLLQSHLYNLARPETCPKSNKKGNPAVIPLNSNIQSGHLEIPELHLIRLLIYT
jgi:hypothetical protein